MAKINVKTKIQAPIKRGFDLARSIDLHKASTSKTNEEAIVCIRSGRMELNETVTWGTKHVSVYQQLKLKIIEFNKPNRFQDILLKGIFKSMNHTHSFEEENDFTKMNAILNLNLP
jgi:ligand-binding SRPBCC domain-containing protein